MAFLGLFRGYLFLLLHILEILGVMLVRWIFWVFLGFYELKYNAVMLWEEVYAYVMHLSRECCGIRRPYTDV